MNIINLGYNVLSNTNYDVHFFMNKKKCNDLLLKSKIYCHK